MVTLNKNNEHIDSLVKNLQSLDPKLRVVVYYGIAEFIIPHFLSSQTDEDILKRKIRATCYKINELAIVDMSQLERIMNNVLSYKLYNAKGYNSSDNAKSNMLASVCFQDILGITKFYSAEDIHNINTNFNLFKVTASDVVNILNSKPECLVGE